jgi:hypothetical protein
MNGAMNPQLAPAETGIPRVEETAESPTRALPVPVTANSTHRAGAGSSIWCTALSPTISGMVIMVFSPSQS